MSAKTQRIQSTSAAVSPTLHTPPAPFNRSPLLPTHERFVSVCLAVKHDGSTRRFYKSVDVVHRLGSVDAPGETGWAIHLAGREVHTAKGFPLVLPTRRLALAIALEWQSQRERIVYSTMPLLNIAIVAIDRVRPDKDSFLDKFTPSIVIDSSCVRVSGPPVLKKLQSKHYDPLLRHLSSQHDITLAPTEELLAPSIVSEADQKRLTALLRSLDEFTIAALDAVTSLSKSVVVALAVMDGRLSLDAAYEACRVEENYQMRTYGRVDGIYGHGVDVEWTRMVLAAARTAGNFCAREDRGEAEAGLVVDNRSARDQSGLRQARGTVVQ